MNKCLYLVFMDKKVKKLFMPKEGDYKFVQLAITNQVVLYLTFLHLFVYVIENVNLPRNVQKLQLYFALSEDVRSYLLPLFIDKLINMHNDTTRRNAKENVNF